MQYFAMYLYFSSVFDFFIVNCIVSFNRNWTLDCWFCHWRSWTLILMIISITLSQKHRRCLVSPECVSGGCLSFSVRWPSCTVKKPACLMMVRLQAYHRPENSPSRYYRNATFYHAIFSFSFWTLSHYLSFIIHIIIQLRFHIRGKWESWLDWETENNGKMKTKRSLVLLKSNAAVRFEKYNRLYGS